MLSRRLAILSLVWACIVAGPAHAEDEFSRAGAYIGAAGVYAFENFSGIGRGNELAYNIRAGYRALPYLAGEAQFEHVPEFDLVVPGAGSVDLEIFALSALAKVVYPSGPFQPYAIGGIGVLAAKTDNAIFGSDREEDLMTRFGGGIDMYFSENIVGTLEGTYVLPLDSVKSFEYVSFTWGFQYRF